MLTLTLPQHLECAQFSQPFWIGKYREEFGDRNGLRSAKLTDVKGRNTGRRHSNIRSVIPNGPPLYFYAAKLLLRPHWTPLTAVRFLEQDLIGPALM
jgi:hypothetical protein